MPIPAARLLAALVGATALLASQALAESTTLTRATLTGGVEGSFVLEGKWWWELDKDGVKRFRFKELRRDASRVYLHDASRDVFLDLDVENEQVWYAQGEGSPKQVLYYLGELTLAAGAAASSVPDPAQPGKGPYDSVPPPVTATKQVAAVPQAAPAPAAGEASTSVLVLFENRTGAVVDLLRRSEEAEPEILGRIHPDTGLEVEVEPGQTLDVGVVGVVIATYEVTARNEKVPLAEGLLTAAELAAEAPLDIENYSENTISAFLIGPDDEPSWLGDVEGGYAMTATLPVGSLVVAATEDGDPLADHLVLPLADETFEIGAE